MLHFFYRMSLFPTHTGKARPQGPENAEYELKKAYNCIIELGTVLAAASEKVPAGAYEELISLYRRAFAAHRLGDRLATERWSRTVKHLARALWHEAKISFLASLEGDLPFLGEAFDEYTEPYSVATTRDLIGSAAPLKPAPESHATEGVDEYMRRGRRHLAKLESEQEAHDLLRAELLLAAHEYGRVAECMGLALEAETQPKKIAS